VWLSPVRKITTESLEKKRKHLRGAADRNWWHYGRNHKSKLCVSNNLLQAYELRVSVGQSHHTQLLYGVWMVALLVTMFKNGQNVPLNHVTVIPLFNSERPNTGWRLTLQTGTIRLQMKEEDFVYLWQK